MSNILKCLKIFNFEQLYLQSKLSFIESLKYNYLASEIFNDLSISPRIKGSKLKSFDQDITILEDFFNSNITNIGTQTGELKKLLKLQFSIKDGLTDSINLCLSNKNDKKYYFLLVELTKSFEVEWNNVIFFYLLFFFYYCRTFISYFLYFLSIVKFSHYTSPYWRLIFK